MAAGPVDIERIRELLRLAEEMTAAEVEIETGGVRIVLRQHATSVIVPQAMPAPDPPAAAPEPEPVKANGTWVKAPTPGTFYTRPAPDKEPFVSVGDQVNVGDTLCILEAMKLMNEIECEVSGTVKEVLVADGEPVEYDQPLFLIGT
ncbi:MAG: acetyl-CoA carboxylase biotin carboxyl carrier protein [Bacteroidota bacterium]|nr:acetyl-CoA carboxylase biotin carboxyl carrier protein [Bacteroidota bacterium]MDE2834828.1 acetyl-CoA carboxylase biotin carboxyl carrier protein [Bacteroidota bacterium]MDE2958030.1 acetyl-CoA carboxylase biotin carboxyl carrier protein [Bacteroidota bacterium]